MLDRGYSVTIFPEGKISKDGQLLPLKLGTGIIATSMFVQIIPLKLEGIQNIWPYDAIVPRKRAVVKVKFGEPLVFKRSESYEVAIEKITQVLNKL